MLKFSSSKCRPSTFLIWYPNFTHKMSAAVATSSSSSRESWSRDKHQAKTNKAWTRVFESGSVGRCWSKRKNCYLETTHKKSSENGWWKHTNSFVFRFLLVKLFFLKFRARWKRVSVRKKCVRAAADRSRSERWSIGSSGNASAEHSQALVTLIRKIFKTCRHDWCWWIKVFCC